MIVMRKKGIGMNWRIHRRFLNNKDRKNCKSKRDPVSDKTA